MNKEHADSAWGARLSIEKTPTNMPTNPATTPTTLNIRLYQSCNRDATPLIKIAKHTPPISRLILKIIAARETLTCPNSETQWLSGE